MTKYQGGYPGKGIPISSLKLSDGHRAPPVADVIGETVKSCNRIRLGVLWS